MGESQTLPPIQLLAHIATGANIDARSAPYWVRGRDHETAHIMSTLSAMPCAISVIAGSPGSGKSTMLAHIEPYARFLGINTIKLRIQDLRDEITLSDALRAVDEAEDATPDAEEVSRTSGIGVDAAVIKAEAKKTRSGTATTQRPLTWQLALQQLGRGEGTLIMMDEMQRLDELHGNPSSAQLVRDFMNELHSEHMQLPRRKIALLGCGLSNTQDVLNSFKMTRVETNHVIRLGPLSLAASREILHDRCTAPTPAGESLPQPPAELVEYLIEVSGGCAHHLAWAGCRLQQQALRVLKRSERTWTARDRDWVLQQAHQDRNSLYRGRKLEREDAAARALAYTLATAVPTMGRALREDAVEKLTEMLWQKFPSEEDPLAVLIRKGTIERRHGDDQFLTLDRTKPHGKHYAFLIPSMARWLREDEQDETGNPWRRDDSEALLRAVADEISDDAKVEEWHWDHNRTLAFLPEEMALPDAGIDATDRKHPRRVESVITSLV